MKKSFFLLSALLALGVNAKNNVAVNIDASNPGAKINKNIYGQFSEHLGSCIYGGLWVGPESSIPNKDGYRLDVFNALKELQVPLMRWPGGCFADEYHWMDGIGPKENRPRMVNNNWGGVVEDNSFGTHEFLNLCELLGCDAYVSMNVGSGSVQETAQWIEYMNAADGPMATLRKQNGREKPWNVKYIGIGNEAWGCGGNMRPEYYSDIFRRYQTYCRNFDQDKPLYKIASGASDYDYEWTDVLMNRIGTQMNAVSLHYYTVLGWNGSKGSATKFDNDDYYWCLGKACAIEPVIRKHLSIMDKYDPNHNIDLLVDEWGTWFDVEPETNPGFLFQQSTMRDAFVAAMSLNIFHKYADRIQMCNIAQVVNVLQSMILTKDDKMVLTPTYFVFKMYKPHMDATYIPSSVQGSKIIPVKNERYNGTMEEPENRELSMVSVTSSKDAKGKLHISLSNADLKEEQAVTINLNGYKAKKVSGEILTAQSKNDCNTFENPDKIKSEAYAKAKIQKDGTITLDMPAMSIITLEVE